MAVGDRNDFVRLSNRDDRDGEVSPPHQTAHRPAVIARLGDAAVKNVEP
jgi:hypothetical protein